MYRRPSLHAVFLSAISRIFDQEMTFFLEPILNGVIASPIIISRGSPTLPPHGGPRLTPVFDVKFDVTALDVNFVSMLIIR